jgi:predicted protein tyrosine phosphatase
MSGDLWICRACDLASLAAKLRPQHILSIAEPGYRNPTPVGIDSDRHHHLHFDDIVEAMPGYLAPSEQHVARIIDLAAKLTETDRILVHCQAGISRSSAAALIILATRNPGQEPDVTRRLREKGPWFVPNRLMVDIADRLIGRGPVLGAALASMGPPTMILNSRPVQLPLRVNATVRGPALAEGAG